MNKQQPETILDESTEESKIAQSDVDHEQAKLSEAELQIEKLKDQLLRKAAEFENYKRRNIEEKSSLIKYGNEQLIAELLPIVDDFQRSLHTGKAANNFETFYTGVELIFNKFNKVLEAKGVKSFSTVGEMFDVNLHDVLMSMPNTTVPDHTILEEVLKGYMLNDKVIRHAKVIVAENNTTPQEQFAVPEEGKN